MQFKLLSGAVSYKRLQLTHCALILPFSRSNSKSTSPRTATVLTAGASHLKFFIAYQSFASDASSSPALRLVHRSGRIGRTFRICKLRLGYPPEPLAYPLLSLSYFPVPAAPSSMPDFCCSFCGRSRAPLCIRRSYLSTALVSKKFFLES